MFDIVQYCTNIIPDVVISIATACACSWRSMMAFLIVSVMIVAVVTAVVGKLAGGYVSLGVHCLCDGDVHLSCTFASLFALPRQFSFGLMPSLE